jgi:hypothetical protein
MPKTNDRLVNHLTPHKPDCPLFHILHANVLFSDRISALPFFDRSYNSSFLHLSSAMSIYVDLLGPQDGYGNHLIIPLSCTSGRNMFVNWLISPITTAIGFHPSSF